MDEFWTKLLYVEIVFFSFVIAILPQILLTDWLRRKDIKKLVEMIYSRYDYEFVTVELVATLAKRNKVEIKNLRRVFEELVNVSFKELRKVSNNETDKSLPTNKNLVINESKTEIVALSCHDYKFKKFNYFTDLLKTFDFEEVFMNLSPDANRELYQIKKNLSPENANTLYRLAERIKELTGEKKKRESFSISLALYGAALTTLGALVAYVPSFRNLLNFFN
ncbi:hypothetical protein [Psychrobacter fulvigenes]|jgi:hypothetical protein|uniref:hypothetical protein n=1 Tax=Psychrobacter fulvigenes TaxID=533323 RepID=UPI001918C7A9|nr:hypothetical protein [Psychrobacter fulvigenes]